MIDRVRECRFCGKRAEVSYLIKYSVRSYAHPQCFDAVHGNEANRLPQFEWQKLMRWRAIAQGRLAEVESP